MTSMTVNTYPDLFWAYTVVWVLVAGYIALLGVRLAKLERFIKAERESETHIEDSCDSKR